MQRVCDKVDGTNLECVTRHVVICVGASFDSNNVLIFRQA